MHGWTRAGLCARHAAQHVTIKRGYCFMPCRRPTCGQLLAWEHIEVRVLCVRAHDTHACMHTSAVVLLFVPVQGSGRPWIPWAPPPQSWQLLEHGCGADECLWLSVRTGLCPCIVAVLGVLRKGSGLPVPFQQLCRGSSGPCAATRTVSCAPALCLATSIHTVTFLASVCVAPIVCAEAAWGAAKVHVHACSPGLTG